MFTAVAVAVLLVIFAAVTPGRPRTTTTAAVPAPVAPASSTGEAGSSPAQGLPAASSTLAAEPAGDACSTQASDVFHRLANGQMTIAQARAQLPPRVPASALTTGLAGVTQYEHDGIDRAAAIDEAAGAVAQSCEY